MTKSRSKARRQPAKLEAWQDRLGQSRPTPEQRKRGDHVLVPTEDAGVKRALNRTVDPLSAAYRRGTITQRQFDAGKLFEALYRALVGSVGPRSCLDFTPVGWEMADSQAEWMAARRVEYTQLCRDLGQERSAIIESVAYWQEALGDSTRRRSRLFVEALDVVADFFQIPEE